MPFARSYEWWYCRETSLRHRSLLDDIFFLFCCNTLVHLCLVIAMEFLLYTDTNFTLFHLLENVIEIACPCTVFSLSADLFNKLSFFQTLDCRVYRFLIHIAFLCNQSPWRKTTAFLFVAVSNEATVNGEFFRFQSKREYSVR